MGVNSRVFDLLGTFCKRTSGGRMLVAGYPDFVADAATVAKHLGHADFPADVRSTEIKNSHGEPQLDYARDPRHVFAALGYTEMDVVDIYPNRGFEHVADLNEPWGMGLYDLVLDHGTIEHCFNIAQAAKNLASSVDENGFIVQHLPLNMFNHGFYNLNPTWFVDFYETNEFRILHLEGWCWKTKEPFIVPPFSDFMNAPEFSLLTCVAQRIRAGEITFPIQRRYRRG